MLDFRILRPTAIDWIFSFASDTTQYYLAFAYYRNAAWHFSLTNMETMPHDPSFHRTARSLAKIERCRSMNDALG